MTATSLIVLALSWFAAGIVIGLLIARRGER